MEILLHAASMKALKHTSPHIYKCDSMLSERQMHAHTLLKALCQPSTQVKTVSIMGVSSFFYFYSAAAGI